MPLRRCGRCRYLFEVTLEVCPSCRRPVGSEAAPGDDRFDEKKTTKRPALKPPKL
jgi:hypothetical protein